MQNIAALGQIDIRWIEPIKSLAAIFSVLNLSPKAFKPSCTMGFNEEWKGYLGSVLAYPCFALALHLVCLAGNAVGPRVNRLSPERLKDVQGTVMMIFFLPISVIAMGPFQCVGNPDKSSSVVGRRSVLCGKGDHTSLTLLAILAMLTYLLPFITLCVWATAVYPKRVVAAGSAEFVCSFKFLFGKYTSSQYTYGLVFLLRKLLVALIPTFTSGDPVLQILLLGLVFTVMLIMQTLAWPWRSDSTNRADYVLTSIIIMILMGGAVLLDGTPTGVQQTLAAIFLVCVVPGGIAICVVSLYHVYMAYLNKNKLFSVSLAYEKSDARALARWFKMRLLDKLPAKSQVFLDVDEFNRLDHIVDSVGYNSRNLVVILTEETLRHLACVSEIAAGIGTKLNIVPVACDGYQPPTDEFISNLHAMWVPSEQAQIVEGNFDIDLMKAALRQFRDLPTVSLCRSNGLSAYEESLEATLSKCLKLDGTGCLVQAANSATSRRGSRSGESAQVSLAITGDMTDKEVFITAVILQRMLRSELEADAIVLSDDFNDKKAELATTTYVIVLLSKGLWNNRSFGHTAATINQSTGIKMIPVQVEETSIRPPPELHGILKAGSGRSSQKDLSGLAYDKVAPAYDALLEVSARKFLVSSSLNMLQAQVQDIGKCFADSADMPAPVVQDQGVESGLINVDSHEFSRRPTLTRRTESV